MAVPAKQQERYTYADYLTWDDDVRRELIDGEIFVMSPAPARQHQVVAGGLFSQINERLLDTDGTCQAFIAPFDVRLPEPGDADETVETVVQPDVLVVCDPSKLDHRGVRGAPDLVVEVISPSTASHDQIRKRKLYERHGVREFWLVHPLDRVAWIYRLSPTGEYAPAEVVECTGSCPVTAVPGLEIDWDRAFARVPREI